MFGDDYIYLSAKAYKDAGYGDITDFKQDFNKFVNKQEHANMAVKQTAREAY